MMACTGRESRYHLLDLQPGLTQMLAQTAGAATDHFVHGPAGVLSQRDSAGGWEWPLADGLGSVRQTVGTVVTQYLLDLQPGLTQMTSFAHARLT
jgi:hypothetical protein